MIYFQNYITIFVSLNIALGALFSIFLTKIDVKIQWKNVSVHAQQKQSARGGT
jgi:hypothetical protein